MIESITEAIENLRGADWTLVAIFVTGWTFLAVFILASFAMTSDRPLRRPKKRRNLSPKEVDSAAESRESTEERTEETKEYINNRNRGSVLR